MLLHLIQHKTLQKYTISGVNGISVSSFVAKYLPRARYLVKNTANPGYMSVIYFTFDFFTIFFIILLLLLLLSLSNQMILINEKIVPKW